MVRSAVRYDHDVSGLEGERRAIAKFSDGAAFDDEVVEDEMLSTESESSCESVR
jgi:hypothetical protein